jgi:hypothetical protein
MAARDYHHLNLGIGPGGLKCYCCVNPKDRSRMKRKSRRLKRRKDKQDLKNGE